MAKMRTTTDQPPARNATPSAKDKSSPPNGAILKMAPSHGTYRMAAKVDVTSNATIHNNRCRRSNGPIEAPKPQAVTVVTADPIVMTVPATGPGDVATVAAGYGQFNTLLAAANAAGVYDRLTMSGPITVFAPNGSGVRQSPSWNARKIAQG